MNFSRLLPIFLLFCLFSFRYQDPLEKIIAGLKRWQYELPEEKVYVHMDKPYYTTGENIWVKVYLMAGPQHTPSAISKVINLELLNPNGAVIEKAALAAKDGYASYSLSIGDSLETGNYTLRAYTQWMKNFDPNYFFHREVKIWNLNKQKSENSVANQLDLQFLPEGGNLIVGFRNKMGIKALNHQGRGVKIKGIIIDQNQQKIADFETNRLGMGMVFLTPKEGNTYSAQLEGSTTTIGLPAAQTEGLGLGVTQNASSQMVVVKIQTKKIGQSVYLVGQTRGSVAYGARVTLANTITIINIPKKDFLHGVAQLTLISESGLPLAERLTFVDHGLTASVKINLSDSVYQPREKVTIDFKVTDKVGKPASANLSLSVCDAEQVLFDANDLSMPSYLYLSSELRGYIESPGYYFNVENADRVEALDHLLLTQGWRKFNYENVVKDKWTEAGLAPQTGLTIKGKLVAKGSQKPVKGGNITYFSTFPVPLTIKSITDEEGNFELHNLPHYDSTKAILQGEKNGNRQMDVLFSVSDENVSLAYPFPLIASDLKSYEQEFIRASAERKVIDQSFDFDGKTVLLDGIEIIGKKEEVFRKETTKLYGSGSNTVKVEDNVELSNLYHPLQLLQGRVAGVQVINDGPSSWNVIIRGTNSILAGTSPLILINNIQADISALNNLSVRDIESVEVWKGADAAIFGSRGSNGVIGFYTRNGSYQPVYQSDGIKELKINGLKVGKTFYAPRYDLVRPEHVKPDRRVTLHWQPTIITDQDGKASVNFYNHDLETSIMGVIEGITADGSPVYTTFKYQIKKN